jgi:hypothetical protein
VLACPVTDCLLVLELWRGKAGMKDAAAACTIHLLECSIVEEDQQKHTVQGDAWFGSVRAAEALGAKGHRAVLQVKNNSGLFPKSFITDVLENALGGVHIVLKEWH